MNAFKTWLLSGAAWAAAICLGADAIAQIQYQNYYSRPPSVAYGSTPTQYGAPATYESIRDASGSTTTVVGVPQRDGGTTTVVGVTRPNGQTSVVAVPSNNYRPASVQYGATYTPTYTYRPSNYTYQTVSRPTQLPQYPYRPVYRPTQLPQYPYTVQYQQVIPTAYPTLYMNGSNYRYCHRLPVGYRPVRYRAATYYAYNNVYYRPYFYRGATVYVVVPRPY